MDRPATIIRNTRTDWGAVTKFFHWFTALLILIVYILGFLANSLTDSSFKASIFILHKSTGITILLLVTLRFFWKLVNVQPAAAEGIDKQMELLARRFHWGLYAVIIIMPLSGWILSSAADLSFEWFGLFKVPDIMGKNNVIYDQADFTHYLLARVLLLLLTGHIVMAMIHHYVHKNKVLTRMLPNIIKPKKFLVLNLSVIALLILALCTMLFTAEANAGDVPSWSIIKDKSKLGFKSSYAGTEFDGRFKEYNARILFDPENPETGLFDVDIDVTSVTTYNSERDFSIGDKDWFYFSKYPQSKYLTKSIKSAGGNKYVAIGTLNLKGHQQDVELRFTWDEYPNGDVKVEGQARMLADADINRVEFGIGEGSWAKDDTVGFVVLVKIDLLLTKE